MFPDKDPETRRKKRAWNFSPTRANDPRGTVRATLTVVSVPFLACLSYLRDSVRLRALFYGCQQSTWRTSRLPRISIARTTSRRVYRDRPLRRRPHARDVVPVSRTSSLISCIDDTSKERFLPFVPFSASFRLLSSISTVIVSRCVSGERPTRNSYEAFTVLPPAPPLSDVREILGGWKATGVVT